MGTRTIALAICLTAAVGASLVFTSDARAQELPLERGDTGPVVQRWQTDLNLWFRIVTPESRGPLEVDGIFGQLTEEATEEFQRGQGLSATGEVDERTRTTMDGVLSRQIPTHWQQRALEWPLVVPSWFWEWGRWYLGRGEFQGRARDDAVRPADAPRVIPRWAWRRMNVMNGQDPERRAAAFAEDRMRAIFGATGIDVSVTMRSDRDPYWVLVAGDKDVEGEAPSGWAVWFQLNQNRWTGWQVTRLRDDDPTIRPDLVPCDIRPAFAEPEC